MKYLWLLPVLFLLSTPAHAASFSQGPVSCSTDANVWYEQDRTGNFTIFVNIDGEVKRFRPRWTQSDIKNINLPRNSGAKSFSMLGKYMMCVVDPSQVTKIGSCGPHGTRSGSCSYCSVGKDGIEKCRHMRGQLVPIKDSPGS